MFMGDDLYALFRRTGARTGPYHLLRRRGGDAAASLLTDLSAYWKLDEATGPRFASVGGTACNLAESGSVGSAVGKVGNAAAFTGSNRLQVASSSAVETGDVDYTIAAWFRANAGGVFRVLVGKDNLGARDYLLAVDGNNVTFIVFLGASFYAATAPATVAVSTWHLAIGWYDSVAKQASVQADNGTVYNAAVPSVSPASNSELQIGARQYPGLPSFFNGRIDEVGLWKRALTTGERAQLWNSGAGLTYPFT